MKRLTLGIALAGLLALAGCGGSGGSVSGGNSQPLLNVCQGCTTNNQCESGRCAQFTSGIWRCVPMTASKGYVCPGGMYKLPGDGDSCG
jgi:hypothetical protein